jgi:hypothetical protein
LRIWDANSGDCIGRLPRAHSSDVFTITCHPRIDGLAVTASYDGSVCYWDIKAKRLVAQHDVGGGSIVCGSFSADGKRSVFSDHLGLVHLFGFGEEYDVPKDQFFKSDWEATRIGDGGDVVDDATGIDVCLLETGPVMDMNMKAYENQPCRFEEIDSGIIEELKHERDMKAALESKRLMLEIECASVTDEKVEYLQIPEPAFVLPEDINDSDFEGDGGIQMGEEEEEGPQVDIVERRDVPSDEEVREYRYISMRRRTFRSRELQPPGSSPMPRRHTRSTRPCVNDSVSSGTAEFFSADEVEIGDLDSIDDGNVIAVPKRIAKGREPKRRCAVPESEGDDIVIDSPPVVKVVELPNAETCSSADEDELGGLDVLGVGQIIAVPKKSITARRPKSRYAVSESEEDEMIVNVLDLPNAEACAHVSLDAPSTSRRALAGKENAGENEEIIVPTKRKRSLVHSGNEEECATRRRKDRLTRRSTRGQRVASDEVDGILLKADRTKRTTRSKRIVKREEDTVEYKADVCDEDESEEVIQEERTTRRRSKKAQKRVDSDEEESEGEEWG